jgi:uncharacterized protein (TIGR02597 family)
MPTYINSGIFIKNSNFPCSSEGICLRSVPTQATHVRRSLFFLFLTLAVFALASLASAQVTTDPVGFTTASLLSNSDTLVSIPFTQPPEFTGAIQSAASNVITVSGSPGWTTNQFVYAAVTQPKHYYALIGSSSPKEGHTYAVTANSGNTLTVDTSSDNLSGITAGTQVVLIPNWTIGTLFRATDANVSFTPSTATRTFKTQILIPNYSGVGVNLAYSTSVYFFSNNVNGTTGNVGWRVVGDNSTPRDDDPLLPDGYIVVRNSNGAPTLPLTALGAVLTKKLAVPLVTNATQAQDNALSMVRPVNVPLASTGLTPADGSFVATTATRNFQDELLVYDNSATSFNKSPSAIYFYSNNVNGTSNNVGWRLVGDNTTPHDSDVIPAGSAFTIRKAANGTGQPVYWTNAATY